MTAGTLPLARLALVIWLVSRHGDWLVLALVSRRWGRSVAVGMN